MDAYDISFTGIRNGEYIIGRKKAKQCSGSILQVRLASTSSSCSFASSTPPFIAYSPSQTCLNEVDPLFVRDVLNNHDFFAALSYEDRMQHLMETAIEKDNVYLNEIDELEVRVIELHGDFMVKNLTESQIQELLAGNPNDPEGYWPLSYIYNLFPRKPNSKARFHTLVFRPSNWCLYQMESSVNSYSGYVLDLYTGNFEERCVNYPNIKILDFANYEMAVIIDKGKKEDVMKMINPEISAHLEWCSKEHPSVFKSLLQKIIRFAPLEVVFINDEVFPAEEVLINTFLLLMQHAGSFNPDLQKWTSGIESSLKRLAVTITEDSFVEDTGQITSLLACALLSNRDKDWFPPMDIIQQWCDLAVTALHDNRQFQYNLKDNKDSNDLNSLILTELGSFDTDIVMFHSVAKNGYCCRPDRYNERNQYMYVEHCLDHHCLTELAHYLPYEDVVNGYGEVFSQLWQKNSACNPRKDRWLSDDSFVLHVQEAQRLLWISKASSFTEGSKASSFTEGSKASSFTEGSKSGITLTPVEINACEKQICFSHDLPDCWLSALIGVQEYKHKNVTYFVMMNTNNVRDIVVLRKPGREVKEETVESEVEDSLIKQFMKGITYPSYMKIKTIPPYLGIKATGVTYFSDTDEYYLLDGKEVIGSWTEIKNREVYIDTFQFKHEYDTHDHWFKLSHCVDSNNGVAENCLDLLQRELQRVDIGRLLYYITGVKSTLQLEHIGRDGTGTNYTVMPEDNLVFEFLCSLSIIFPTCVKRQDNKFLITNYTIWSCICDEIKSGVTVNCDCTSASPSTSKWKENVVEEKRKLWMHQVDALNKLKETNQHSLIWIPPGLGKTAIITNYISWCIINKTMPKYCIYTLPPSALKSVVNEFTLLSLPHNVIDMTNKSKNKTILPHCVNFVVHDHLRLLDFNSITMPQTLFIIDEFHKTLNKTQRTSTALNMAALSWRFIGMTGTLIKDTHLEYIIEWLRMNNNFEVTKDNFWLALTSLICHKVTIPITINRQVISYEMSSEHLSRYQNCVPVTLGGKASNIKWKEAVDISYLATTEALFNTCCDYLQNGKRCFIVVRNVDNQLQLRGMIEGQGYTCLCITGNNSVSLTSEVRNLPDVVITTIHHCEGYNLTAYSVMLTGVYFSNAATREQLERRIIRIGQKEPEVNIIIIHTGILSYVHSRYEKVRSLSSALKSLASEVNLDYHEVE